MFEAPQTVESARSEVNNMYTLPAQEPAPFNLSVEDPVDPTKFDMMNEARTDVHGVLAKAESNPTTDIDHLSAVEMQRFAQDMTTLIVSNRNHFAQNYDLAA